MAKRGGPVVQPVVTLIVDEIAATEKIIEKNGGKVVQKRHPIGDGAMGVPAYFKDPEGNTIGLLQRGQR
jgi:predicted enzyme related to lactoylglutathione lyase